MIPISRAPRFRSYLAAGLTRNEALANLRKDGASIFDAIKTVKEYYGLSIADAKGCIQESEIWKDRIPFLDTLEDELSKEDTNAA